MRLVVAVRMKQREKTLAAQVKKNLSTTTLTIKNNVHCSLLMLFHPPEFDDLEMCTSLSHQQNCEGDGGTWYAGNCSCKRAAYDTGGESAPLQHLVEDLRSQLTRCHKVIRGLQMRVRSLSVTSDYASSLERTPRKVL